MQEGKDYISFEYVDEVRNSIGIRGKLKEIVALQTKSKLESATPSESAALSNKI